MLQRAQTARRLRVGEKSVVGAPLEHRQVDAGVRAAFVAVPVSDVNSRRATGKHFQQQRSFGRRKIQKKNELVGHVFGRSLADAFYFQPQCGSGVDLGKAEALQIARAVFRLRERKREQLRFPLRGKNAGRGNAGNGTGERRSRRNDGSAAKRVRRARL